MPTQVAVARRTRDDRGREPVVSARGSRCAREAPESRLRDERRRLVVGGDGR